MMCHVSEMIFYRNKDNKLNRSTIGKEQRVSPFRAHTHTHTHRRIDQAAGLCFLAAFGVKEKSVLRPFSVWYLNMRCEANDGEQRAETASSTSIWHDSMCKIH